MMTVNWGIVVLFATALVGSCKLFGPDLVAAHDDAIIRCDRNLKVDHVTKVGEEMFQNGLLDEHYDRNDDGVADIHVLSSITGTTTDEGLVPHRPSPIIWQVDLDFDGQIDRAYIDIHGESRCEDIMLYLDYHAPLSPDVFRNYDPTVPRGAEEDEPNLPEGGHL